MHRKDKRMKKKNILLDILLHCPDRLDESLGYDIPS